MFDFKVQKINAPAPLVFENFLDITTWPQWSQSVVDADIICRAAPMYEHSVASADSVPGSPRIQKRSIKTCLSSTLKLGAEAALWTVEDPRRPWAITSSKLIVTMISMPKDDSTSREGSEGPHQPLVSTIERQCSSISSISQQASTSNAYDILDAEMDISYEYQDSFIISYSVTASAPKSDFSQFSIWNPFRVRTPYTSSSYKYFQIITPMGSSACTFRTIVQPEKRVSTRRSTMSRTKDFFVASPKLDPTASSKGILSCMRTIARDLGGYCVRQFSDQQIFGELAPEHQELFKQWEIHDDKKTPSDSHEDVHDHDEEEKSSQYMRLSSAGLLANQVNHLDNPSNLKDVGFNSNIALAIETQLGDDSDIDRIWELGYEKY